MGNKVGIVILAAGNSSRLGQPKQLLEYNGCSLLQNAVLQAQLLPNSHVVVVSGAYKECIEKELISIDVAIAHNLNWKEGMASSLDIGLQKVLTLEPSLESCIFAVCDQPFLNVKVFKDLLDQFNKTDKNIIAAAYAETLGTPVLFGKNYFASFLNLKGKEGAKKMIQMYKDDVESISFEKGCIDIDTIKDYNNLINL